MIEMDSTIIQLLELTVSTYNNTLREKQINF